MVVPKRSTSINCDENMCVEFLTENLELIHIHIYVRHVQENHIERTLQSDLGREHV